MLNAGAFSNADVVKASEGLVRVKVDGDKFPDQMTRFGVRGYPTIKFFDPDGTEVGELNKRDPESVKNKFEAVVAQFGKRK